MPSATAIRFNQLATIDHFDAKDGVMTVTAIAREPGVLAYKDRDGSVRRELVSHEFLRRLDSDGMPLISRIGGAPICNEHPIDGLIRNDADRLKRYKVGESHHKIHVYTDGKTQVTFDVFDPETQDDIKFGRKDGISVGYLTNVKHEAGTWHGEHFDAMQDEPFEVDHIAVCKTPRANGARIKAFKFDSAEVADIAWQIDSVEPQKSASAEEPTAVKPTGEEPMSYTTTVMDRPITLDSADDAEVVNKLKAYVESLETKVDSLQAKLDAKKKASDEDEEDMEDDGDDEDMEDKNGKPLPAFIRNRMKKKNDAIADLEARIDSLSSELETKDGELAVLQTIVGRADSEEESTERMDAETIATEVQARLDSLFEAYNDAKEYLPAEFKLDGQTTVASIQTAALQSLDAEFKLDSDEAIAGAYATMKRWARKDSGVQLERLAIASSAPESLTRNDAMMTKKTTKRPLTFMKKKGAC